MARFGAKLRKCYFFFDKCDIYFFNVKRFGEKKIKGSFFGQMDIFLLYLITNLSEKNAIINNICIM